MLPIKLSIPVIRFGEPATWSISGRFLSWQADAAWQPRSFILGNQNPDLKAYLKKEG
jgi:hypothetical protein